jgi:chromosome partitioning protein
MAHCTLCGKTGVMLTLDNHSLCRDCQNAAARKIATASEAIRDAERGLAAASSLEERLAGCRKIVELAEELIEYEEKGIPTFDPPPSSIIRKYSDRHDRLIVEHSPDAIRDTLARVQRELHPYRAIQAIGAAVRSLREAQRLAATARRQNVIAVINQKGGVGKTTAAVNIGIGLAMLGKRVLLIDLDPQANLTEALGISGEECPRTVYDVLRGTAEIHDTIVSRDGVDVVPSNVLLAKAEQELTRQNGNHYALRSAIRDMEGYDYIFIDCLPSLGNLSLNALMAADELYVPMLPEYFALSGVRKLMDAVEYVETEGKHQIHLSTVIFSRYNRRKSHHNKVVEKIREYFGTSLAYYYIRESISLAEALSEGKSIFAYQPLSHGAIDYFLVCREIAKRDGAGQVEEHPSADTVPVQESQDT